MIFYQCDVKIPNLAFHKNFEEHMSEIRGLNKKIDSLNSRSNVNYQIFLHDVKSDSISFDFSASRDDIANSIVDDALKGLGLDSTSIFVKEISEQAFSEKLRECLGVKYIHDESLIRRLGGKAYLSRMPDSYKRADLLKKTLHK